MRPAELVRAVRTETGLSVRALAEAANVAASTVHRIERGELQPTVEILVQIAEAAGFRLRVDAQVDHRTSIVGWHGRSSRISRQGTTSGPCGRRPS